MELAGREDVALHALLLRACANLRHYGEVSWDEDVECGHSDTLSFAHMLAHYHFCELDWFLVGVLADEEDSVTRVARELVINEQPFEAEALLHARGKRCGSEWARPFFFNERWRLIRKSMRAFEREGITTNHEALNDLAEWAVHAAA
jgi:hypothetical protein